MIKLADKILLSFNQEISILIQKFGRVKITLKNYETKYKN